MEGCARRFQPNRLTSLVLATLSVWGGYAAVCAAESLDAALAAEESRVIHRFDFDEPENYDTIPRNWIRFPDPAYADTAFPRYTEGGFDAEVGHDAGPSFYLQSRGRNVAFRYDGPATRIRPGNHLVTGWIKCDTLDHSRAAISAYYLDWEGNFLSGTQGFSRLVASDTEGDGWQQVEVYLPRSPREAHYIGVTCWVIQQEVWRHGEMPHRFIEYRDTRGGAWFDDIAILGLPRAVLSSAHAGHVFEKPERVQLTTSVSDNSTSGLSAKLRVSDRYGVEVFTTGVACYRYENEHVDTLALPELDPGPYRAALDVYTGAEHLLTQELTFVVLAASDRPPNYVASRMGVIFEGASAGQAGDELALIEALRLGAVKLPLWPQTGSRGFDDHREKLHELLDALILNRVAVTGVFAGPPSAMARSAGRYARPLLDILTADPDGWRDPLNAVVAPYASILSHWQFGGDGDASFIHDERVSEAVTAVRQVMSEMITVPRLTTVATAADLPTETLAVENLSVAIPGDVRPSMIDAHLAPYRERGYDRLWASLPNPDPQKASDSDLADWALRLVEARWAGADVVFVSQLWKTRSTINGPITEPNAAYVVYRTVLDAIGDAWPAERLQLDDDAQALAFNDAAQAVLVMWDPLAPASGRAHTLQLGAVRKVVDIWGRPVPIERTPEGHHRIVLSASPVFAQGTEPWLVTFRAELRLRPQTIKFSVEPQLQTLEITNPRDTALSGDIVLAPPPGWEIEPNRFQFALEPGAIQAFNISVRHPNSEPAGIRNIEATIEFKSDQAYPMNVPLQIELAAPDLEVWGYAVLEEDALVVRHGVTSRAREPLSFQLFAVYPGRSRQYRVINTLLPGQTLTVEYRFPDTSEDSGRSIRLGLREVNGPRIHNSEVTIP